MQGVTMTEAEPGPLVRFLRHPRRPRIVQGPRANLPLPARTVDDDHDRFSTNYHLGTVTWLPKLGLFAVGVLVAGRRQFLGYWPQQAMAERAVRAHEQLQRNDNSGPGKRKPTTTSERKGVEHGNAY